MRWASCKRTKPTARGRRKPAPVPCRGWHTFEERQRGRDREQESGLQLPSWSSRNFANGPSGRLRAGIILLSSKLGGKSAHAWLGFKSSRRLPSIGAPCYSVLMSESGQGVPKSRNAIGAIAP